MNANIKSIRKIIIASIFIGIFTFTGYALDNSNVISLDFLGNVNYAELEQELSSEDYVRGLAVGIFAQEGMAITDFMAIDEENANEMDYEMIDVLEDYIYQDYSDVIMIGDTYISMVLDRISGSGLCCWMTFSTYYQSDEGEFLVHFPFYMAVDGISVK